MNAFFLLFWGVCSKRPMHWMYQCKKYQCVQGANNLRFICFLGLISELSLSSQVSLPWSPNLWSWQSKWFAVVQINFQTQPNWKHSVLFFWTGLWCGFMQQLSRKPSLINSRFGKSCSTPDWRPNNFHLTWQCVNWAFYEMGCIQIFFAFFFF